MFILKQRPYLSWKLLLVHRWTAVGNPSSDLKYILSKTLAGLTTDLPSGGLFWPSSPASPPTSLFWVSLCTKLILSLLAKALALALFLSKHTYVWKHTHLARGFALFGGLWEPLGKEGGCAHRGQKNGRQHAGKRRHKAYSALFSRKLNIHCPATWGKREQQGLCVRRLTDLHFGLGQKDGQTDRWRKQRAGLQPLPALRAPLDCRTQLSSTIPFEPSPMGLSQKRSFSTLKHSNILPGGLIRHNWDLPVGWGFWKAKRPGTCLRMWGLWGTLVCRKMHIDKFGHNIEDWFMDVPTPWTCPLTPQFKGPRVKNLFLALTCNSSRGICGQPVVTHSHL